MYKHGAELCAKVMQNIVYGEENLKVEYIDGDMYGQFTKEEVEPTV